MAAGLVHGGAGPGVAEPLVVPVRLARCHRRVAAFVLSSCKENTMSQSETEIHRIVLRLLREGYSALNAAQRKVVDSLMAVC